MEIKEVLGEKWLLTSFAMQSLFGVRFAMGLISHFLKEFFPTFFTLVLPLSSVKKCMSFQTGSMGKGLRTFLTNIGS